jgi:hypothetical protein
MMQKQNFMDILAPEERVYTPEAVKIAISFEFMGTRTLYNQSNPREKYLFFSFEQASGHVI